MSERGDELRRAIGRQHPNPAAPESGGRIFADSVSHMADYDEWLQAQLAPNIRYGLADLIETQVDASNPDRDRLVRVLRSSRNELLISRPQAAILLQALNVDRGLPSLRARLEPFLAEAKG